jgi:hypothetical protein
MLCMRAIRYKQDMQSVHLERLQLEHVSFAGRYVRVLGIWALPTLLTRTPNFSQGGEIHGLLQSTRTERASRNK